MTSFREYAGMPPAGPGQAPAPGNTYADFLMQAMPQMMQQAHQMKQPGSGSPAARAGQDPTAPLGLPPAPMGAQPPMPPQRPGQGMPMPPQGQPMLPPQGQPMMPPQGGADPNQQYRRGAFLAMMRQGAQGPR